MKTCTNCKEKIAADEGSINEDGEFLCFACAKELEEESDKSVCPDCGESTEEFAENRVCSECGFESEEEAKDEGEEVS